MLVFLLFLLFIFTQATRYGVSLKMAGYPVTPLEPVTINLFVKDTAAPCCTSSSKPLCCAPPKPTYTLSGSNSVLAVSWGGCPEAANSPDCYNGFASPSTSALIVINSPIGNCSVAINRTSLQPNQCMGINGMGQCTYTWHTLVRNCGGLACSWNPSTEDITIACYAGNCASPSSIPLDSCVPTSMNPWLFDPSHYTLPESTSTFKCFKNWIGM